MSSVYPTAKGVAPWQFCNLDLIEIRNKPGEGDLEIVERYVLVAIDAYSKFPEIVILPNKSSMAVREAFRDNVVFRYGAPFIVRTDQGKEFEGAF